MRLTSEWRLTPLGFLPYILAVAVGLVTALAVARLPILGLLAITIAIGFAAIFLGRPDLGLLVVVFARSSTDLSFSFGWLMIPREGFGALPNIGLILTLTLAGGILILARGVSLISLPGGRPLTLLLLAGLIGIWRSDNTLFAINEWLPVLASFITYALAAHLFRTVKDIQRVVDVIMASFLLPAIFGLFQLVRGQGIVGPGFPVPRVFGTFVHPNPFGFYLVLLISLFLCQASWQTGKRRAFALAALPLAGLLLAATFTRVAWAGALVALVVIGILRIRLVLFALPIFAILAIALSPAVGARLADTLGGSLADRVYYLWPAILAEWRVVTLEGGPLLLVAVNRFAGLGPGAGQILSAPGYGASVPHNDYIRVFVEYGAFGLLMFLTLIVVLGVFAFRTWRAAAKMDPTAAAVTLTFLAATIAFPLMSLTDNVFGYTVNQVYFWTLAGLAVAVSRMAHRGSVTEVTSKGVEMRGGGVPSS